MSLCDSCKKTTACRWFDKEGSKRVTICVEHDAITREDLNALRRKLARKNRRLAEMWARYWTERFFFSSDRGKIERLRRFAASSEPII